MIGVDEVGRGSLAGPLLVVAARQTGVAPEGLMDSKLMTRDHRESIFEMLVANFDFGEGWVKSVEIDRLGLTGAMRIGVKRALRQVRITHRDEIIMDGPINYFPRRYQRVQCLIDADATVPIVSAASVYAKVVRDRFMIELARRHPRYGFDSHVGYCTPQHLAALKKFGSLKRIHRQFYEPVWRLNEVAWLQVE